MKPLIVLAILAAGLGSQAAPAEGPEQASWKVLNTAAGSGNPEVRLQAVAALETMGAQNPQAVDRLTVFLRSDKSVRVRAAAATALGQMNAEHAIPALRAALKDKNEVAFAAARSLVRLGDPEGRATVVAVMYGQRSASPSFMSKARREVARRMRHPQTLAFAGAAGATSVAFPPAAPAVAVAGNARQIKNADPDPPSVDAVDCLASDPNPNNVRLLEGALHSKHPEVRAETAKSLGARGDLATIPRLEPLLQDHHANVRTMAAASIIRLSYPREAQSRAANSRR